MVRLKPSPTQSLPSGEGVSWLGTLYIKAFEYEDSSDDLEPSIEHPQGADNATASNLLSSSSAEKKPSLWDQRRGGDAHPLHGHPGLEPFNDMQVLIIDAIAEIGEPAGFDQILNSVSSRWRGIKIRRRDGTPYTTDCRRAIQANLRTNPHQVSLFIRVTTPDGGAAWRFSQSIVEAEEAKIKSKFDKGKEPKAEDGSLLPSSASPLDSDALNRKSNDDSSEDSMENDAGLLLEGTTLTGRASMIGSSLSSPHQGRPVRTTRHAGGYNLSGFSSDDDRGDDEIGDRKALALSALSGSYTEASQSRIRITERRDPYTSSELDIEAPSAKRKAPLPTNSAAQMIPSPAASNVSFSPPPHVAPHQWNEMLAQQAAAVAKMDPSILMGHYLRPDLVAQQGWMPPIFGYQPYFGGHPNARGGFPHLQHQMAASLDKASQSSSAEIASSLTTNNPSWHSSDSAPSAHMTFSTSSTSTSSRSSTSTSSATIADSALRMTSSSPSTSMAHLEQQAMLHHPSQSSFAAPNAATNSFSGPNSPPEKNSNQHSFPNPTWS